MKQNTIQAVYDQLFMESAHRARIKGDKVPTEVEIFTVLVKSIREAIMRGEESTEALHELGEVKSFHIREEEEQRRKYDVEQALKEGYLLDLDAIK